MADHTGKVYRLLPAAAAALVMLIPAGETASANSASDNPFEDAVQVADARLDTMRGGFGLSNGAMVNFGIDVQFQSLEKLNGAPPPVNLGTTASGYGIISNLTVSNNLNPNTPITATTSGNIVVGSVNQTIGSNTTNVTTTLTNSGIVTTIQNTAPNTTLQTQQILSVQTTGLVQNAVRGGTVLIRPLTIFH